MRRRDRIYLWLRDHPLVVDSAFALTLFVLVGLTGWPVLIDPQFMSAGSSALWAVSTGLDRLLATVGAPVVTAGLTLPLALRRVRPVWCGGLVAATAIVQWALALPIQGAQIGVLVALHGLAAYAPRWASRGGLALGMAGALMVGVRYFTFVDDVLIVFVGITALVLAAWALGDLQRVRRQQLEALRDRARRLEVEREQEARLAAADERARIAREMHDVVAHSLSIVIAQADGGRYASDSDPKAAVRACETISQTGRAALTDMRQLLGVLRTDDGASRAPTPGLAEMEELIAAVRDSGLDVGFTTMGEPREVSSGVGLTAYRIVQEALTNVMKHAGPDARADVRLDWTPAGLMIAVVDDGRGAAADSALKDEPQGGSGHGIPGMTERAALYGGKLQAGPVPGGGFAVRAHLPYPSGERMRR
ncbi:sensor histidine kinase [Phytoactinopolyspora halotolerans]|uniref:sensor histidine kinase n=1 Tax=Phytoactinopolyspora halotolerans TaxID=1981512 RepID=UPI001C201B44|nr:sensor histidine kinase [Phytoactinopolyspora halotolerans]